ncbi:MAG TPA: hypothetical protein VI318_22605 [Baekduia sp.]
MPDSHLSLLRAVARHRQRRVEHLDDAVLTGTPTKPSAGRRIELKHAAARARAQVAAAQARRRQPPRS